MKTVAALAGTDVLTLTLERHISPVQFSELLSHESRRLWFAKHHEIRTFVRRAG